ncbi:MAG: hypothetical protein JSR59_05580 [Proteobacteria bacterium]|nr:hypothetical protein [Pseudomonadota bacterium]
MNFLHRGLGAALIALAAIAPAQAAQPALATVANLPEGARPAGVPLDYVVTPNGYFHPSCVVRLAAGETVLEDGSVQRSDGSRRAVAACLHAAYETRAAARNRQPDAAAFDGWLAYSLTDPDVTPPASGMVADWTVPEAPANASGQVLYYFPGLEAVPNTRSILQPVLGWNGYNNAAWTMANWNCCIRGTVYTDTPFNVNVGDAIHGQMRGTGCTETAPCKAWQIVSTDTTNGRTTTMRTRAYGQVFNWYFGGVMEVYGIRSCDQLPASGSVAFTGVRVVDFNGQPVRPPWQTQIDNTAPACSYGVDTGPRTTTITFDPAS